MARLNNVLGLLDKIQSADISVYQQRCVVVRNRNAVCTRCADACTSGAIALHDNELVVAPSECIGCGVCTTMCPTCALEAHRPNDAELQRSALAAMRANDGVAVLACHHIVDAAHAMLEVDKLVAVECLGRIEESLTTALALAGARLILFVRADCTACSHAVGLETAKAVCETSNRLLGAWGQDARVEIVERFPASVRDTQQKQYDESRRNFFFRTKETAKDVAVVAVEQALSTETDANGKQPRYVKVLEDGTLPHFIPDRRERLLDNLAAMGNPKNELIETRLWGHVHIDIDACNSCRMCAAFCPTGALKKFDADDGAIGIEHYSGDCVLCRCCEDICPTDALELCDEVFAPDVLSGALEHIELRPLKYNMNGTERARTMFRDILKCGDIYDR